MSKLNRGLLFRRAWHRYKVRVKHGEITTFAKELKSCYRTAKMIGYENYKVSTAERIYNKW